MNKILLLILIVSCNYCYGQSSYLGSQSVGSTTKTEEPSGKLYGPLNYRSFAAAINEKFIFLPMSSSLQKYGYDHLCKKKDSFSGHPGYKDNVGKILTLTAVDNDWAELTDEKGKKLYANINLGSIEGIGPVADIDSARIMYLNKTLWIKKDYLNVYDAAKDDFAEEKVTKLQPVKVVEIVAGFHNFAPVRFVVETETHQKGYFDCSLSGTNNGEILRVTSSFNKIFFEKDPRKTYNWSEDTWLSIINSQIKIGMTKEQAILSWGEPVKINRSINGAGLDEQWVYGSKKSQYLYFSNGTLTSSN